MVEQALLRADECAAMCSISRKTWDRMKSSGFIPPSHKLRNARVWKRSDIDLWIEYDFPNLDKFVAIKESLN